MGQAVVREALDDLNFDGTSQFNRIASRAREAVRSLPSRARSARRLAELGQQPDPLEPPGRRRGC